MRVEGSPDFSENAVHREIPCDSAQGLAQGRLFDSARLTARSAQDDSLCGIPDPDECLDPELLTLYLWSGTETDTETGTGLRCPCIHRNQNPYIPPRRAYG